MQTKKTAGRKKKPNHEKLSGGEIRITTKKADSQKFKQIAAQEGFGYAELGRKIFSSWMKLYETDRQKAMSFAIDLSV